ncbi:MAG: MCP four helix bundle domain-containing protein [Bacteroidales bacterium]|nr:MCP four helix bundle domain-containing protein [Bacteroidales bacterium]
MKKTLKLKIYLSFLLLIAMLAVAGVVSIYEFHKLSDNLQSLIEDNYKTIKEAKNMVESLEREDSGVLLLMMGEWENGRTIIDSADNTFKKAFDIVKNNITEAGEDKYIINIKNKYEVYKKEWLLPVVGTSKQNDIVWYKNNVHQKFLDVKEAVNSLIILNEESMHDTASTIKDKAHRAIMPGIVSIIAALIFSLMLSFFITRYFVHPIEQLVQAVKFYEPNQKLLNSNISSNDEIKQLEQSINNLLVRLVNENNR